MAETVRLAGRCVRDREIGRQDVAETVRLAACCGRDSEIGMPAVAEPGRLPGARDLAEHKEQCTVQNTYRGPEQASGSRLRAAYSYDTVINVLLLK